MRSDNEIIPTTKSVDIWISLDQRKDTIANALQLPRWIISTQSTQRPKLRRLLA
jgi:hypothetical protein